MADFFRTWYYAERQTADGSWKSCADECHSIETAIHEAHSRIGREADRSVYKDGVDVSTGCGPRYYEAIKSTPIRIGRTGLCWVDGPRDDDPRHHGVRSGGQSQAPAAAAGRHHP